jgi:hypothetical protein
VAIYLLQEFDDVLPEDISIGLPPLDWFCIQSFIS